MNYVFVIAKDGTPLMPTSPAHARRLLKSGRATAVRYRPLFVIQLTGESGKGVQETELCVDAGIHIGLSLKSEKHEYIDLQADNLPDEKKRHDSRRKYRRARRSRKRYRQPRFSNRTKSKKWLAPTIQHMKENHVRLIKAICQACHTERVIVEIGSFDTQLLAATEKGEAAPQGKDYQRGDRLGYRNTREAVFARDGHTCQICGKGVKDGAILRMHHLGYLRHDRSNRMDNLLTVCKKCHTPKNHKPGGKLYGLKPKLKTLKGAAFMNTVRWQIIDDARTELPGIEIMPTYGYITKQKRIDRNIAKSHANDAYAMGDLHPKHRTPFAYIAKKRRNNRVLEKFYDAAYIDIRDGKRKKAAELGCGRTDRSMPRNSPDNERVFRGQKKSDGRRSVRRQRYSIQAGDTVFYDRAVRIVHGLHTGGRYAEFKPRDGLAKLGNISRVTVLKKEGGWRLLPAQ